MFKLFCNGESVKMEIDIEKAAFDCTTIKHLEERNALITHFKNKSAQEILNECVQGEI